MFAAAKISQNAVAGVTEWALVTNYDDVSAAITTARIITTDGVDPARIQPLLEDAAAFIRYNMGQPDPAAYIAWRLSRGYRWAPYSRLQAYGIAKSYEYNFGEKFGEDERSIQAAFVRSWRHGRKNTAERDGRRPVRISTDSRGVVAAAGVMTRENPYRLFPWPMDFGEDYWDSPKAGRATMMQWLLPPDGVDSRALMLQSGSAEFAKVAVLVEYENGERTPLYLTYVWDTHSQQWWMEWITEQYHTAVIAGMTF